MKSNIICLFIALVLTALVTKTTNAQSPEQSPAVPAEYNIGKLLYGKFCASCHGVDLKGTENGPPFIHRVYHPGHHADGSFYLAVKRGVRAHHWKFGNMPPVEGVNDGMVGAIVKFIRYVQKKAGVF